jgi:hypothetical protein
MALMLSFWMGRITSTTNIGDALWFARSKRPEVQANFQTPMRPGVQADFRPPVRPSTPSLYQPPSHLMRTEVEEEKEEVRDDDAIPEIEDLDNVSHSDSATPRSMMPLLSPSARSIYLTPRATHDFNFFAQFVTCGGGPYLEYLRSTKCTKFRVPSSELWSWVLRMEIKYRPTCRTCKCVFLPQKIRNTNVAGISILCLFLLWLLGVLDN